jgi:hypothetical protein
MWKQYRTETMNQWSTPMQTNKVTTFGMANLEEQQLNGEKKLN